MPVSEAKKAADKRWKEKNYTQVKLSMSKKEAKALADYCAFKGYKKAGFIRQLIKDAIAADPDYIPPEENDTPTT